MYREHAFKDQNFKSSLDKLNDHFYKKNKVSVIIPCHNYGRFLSDCLKSVFNQTVLPFEVIVVDDSSEDNTKEVCDLYSVKYHRVGFKSANESRKFGYEKSSGKWAIFLDADDMLTSNYIQKMLAVVDADHDVVFCDAQEFGYSNNYFKCDKVVSLQEGSFCHVSCLVRSDSIKKSKAFEEKNENFYEDWEFWKRMENAGCKFKKSEAVLLYRNHGASRSKPNVNKNISIRIKENSLRLVAYVHGYLPNLNAGAEVMLHQIFCGLKKSGHDVSVITKNPGATSYEGVSIFDLNSKKSIDLIRNCDIIFTHLDLTKDAIDYGNKYKKPLVHLVHNDLFKSTNEVYRGLSEHTCSLAVANSKWISNKIDKNIKSIVLYPPTDFNYYKTRTTRESISLINMNEAKGGKIFWQLARIFPDRKFIGVLGSYGEQISYKNKLKNVTIIQNNPDIKKVYSQTRILIMPSSYESWGRVGIEAACSGIPCIAAPTDGLKESLSNAGIFVDSHDDVAGFVEAIKFLDKKENYEKYSKLAINRAKVISNSFPEQLKNLELELRKINFMNYYYSS